MKKLIAALGVGIALTACTPVDGPVSAGSPDPLFGGNGTFLVPDEIKPGDYRAMQLGELGGFVEVCADAACVIGTSGFINNYLVEGSSVIHVPEHAFSVKVINAKLEAL